jgi:hypothetical protein
MIRHKLLFVISGMKPAFLSFVIIFFFCSCNDHTKKNSELEKRIDSLQRKIIDVYKPGLGEFMSSIQVHHAKLWFAGKNQNWKLADFEIQEIKEILDNIKKYETERDESKLIGMLDPAVDSVNIAIQKQSASAFKNSFLVLTNTCNECHRTAHFGFNVVKIPDTPPFSNQEFDIILHKK